jgi:hypothetical protein
LLSAPAAQQALDQLASEFPCVKSSALAVQVSDVDRSRGVAQQILEQDPGNTEARKVVDTGGAPAQDLMALLASASASSTAGAWPSAAAVQRSVQDRTIRRMLPLIAPSKVADDSAMDEGTQHGAALAGAGSQSEELTLYLDHIEWVPLANQVC